jgi:O-antigen ligase
VKSKTLFSEIAMHRVYQILLFAAPVTTLAVNPWTSYDPISLPKMLVLVSSGTSLALLLILRRREIAPKLPRNIWLLSALFSGWLLLVLLFSGAPLSQQFWGSFGRNTGFVTYTALLIILLSAATLQNKVYYAGFTKALVGTAIPMTAYCLVQMAGKDPVGWSEFATFGTLGNVNFLSAFFGMTSVACLAFVFSQEFTRISRFFLASLGLLDLYIAYSTGSIQGVVIFVAGLFALIFLAIRNYKGKLSLLYSGLYFIVLLMSVTAGIFGLLNKGPLSPLLFQQSLVFRTDYIHAGWEMTLKKPIFGVGLDSYGDWYREARGEISTLRMGVDRISNSAHNIFLDISSNGGVVLGLTFIAILFFALISAIKYARAQNRFDPYFSALASVWFAYQIQALVSINQLGVGIWGWLLSGALIGYGQIANAESSQRGVSGDKLKLSKTFKGAQLSAKDSMAALAGFVIGLVIMAPPLSADIAYRSANLTGDINKISLAVNRIGSTQFHKELALDFAMKNNREIETGAFAKNLVSEYPRNFFAWRVLSVLTASSLIERQKALLRARELDPFNPDLG